MTEISKPGNAPGICELIQSLMQYADAPATTPIALIQAITSKIDKSYKAIGIVGIGAEGILLACENVLEEKIAVKIARLDFIAEAPKDSHIGYKLSHWIGWHREHPQRRLEIRRTRFLDGCKIQNEVARAIADKNVRFFHVPSIRKISQVDALFVEMDFVEGVTLLRHLREKNSLRYTLGKFRELLQIFDFLHGLGFIFRDVKNDHVMITTNERIALIDWTLAKRVGRNLTLADTQIGTFPMSSPKQLSGDAKDASPTDDVFGLGFLLWQYIMQKDLPRIGMTDDLNVIAEYVKQLASELPPVLQDLFLKACKVFEDNRIQTCQEFLRLLEQAIELLGFKQINNEFEPSKTTIRIDGDRACTKRISRLALPDLSKMPVQPLQLPDMQTVCVSCKYEKEIQKIINVLQVLGEKNVTKEQVISSVPDSPKP